ncbi:MAG: BamA/TamA family outer membrane protein, partial [Rhodothermales bacterium]|nr:BamA/TamA family outer membrane protein [Rhodothermales bacterium]
ALGWDTKSDLYLREAILEDALPPIERLGGFYAYRGGQGVWDYVAEQYGREKIGEVLLRLRTTRSVEASFKRATGLGLDDLSERWHRALKEIHFPEIAAREPLDEVARPILTRENAGFYNTSPALSPLGDKVAFVTTRSGLFDVYIASTHDGTLLKKLIAGQTTPAFESLRILTPGLAWSPDGSRIALAVKSGAADAIAVVDAETGAATHYRVPGVDQILSVAWSPDGGRLAFEGSMNAQSDLYVLDLETRETTNHTNDVFSDHEPAWSPDGTALVFHSDRGAHTRLGREQPGTFEVVAHDYGQFDLYRLRLGEQEAERLTRDETWDETNARFGADPDRLLFLSDRNGIPNLYEKDLTTGAERPLTDVVVGILQAALSADGKRAALVSLKDGTPSIYLLNTPFERRLDQDVLAPTVWAQRVMQQTPRPAPALALAPPSLVQGNPFLRDASDGLAFARRTRPRPDAGGLPGALPFLTALDSSFAALGEGIRGTNGTGSNGSPETAADSIGALRVDFRNYVFSEAFDAARADDAILPWRGRDASPEQLGEDGRYTPQRYKLKFSPDLIYGAAGYDALYGVQGVTQMMFSDMLGNHRIFVATNLLIDLRNSDYLLAYHYLPRRLDYSLSAFHVSRLLLDASFRVYRYRWFGTSLALSYPLDKFRRVDADLSFLGVSQADVSDPSRPAETQRLFYPRLTFTRDVTTPGFLYPRSGTRLALSLSGSPGTLTGDQMRFVSVLADGRTYASFGRGLYTAALRGSAGTSFGPDRQLFYTSGVQNWINRRFDQTNGFPINDLSDFVFATPILPLRGHAINARNGAHFGLVNAEFRFPLVAAVLPGPLPILPLYHIQGTAFADAGAIWGGRADNPRFNVVRHDDDGDRVFDDVLAGAGLGLRTILLGYPVRLDWAWPFDGRRFGDRRVYLSVGLDF